VQKLLETANLKSNHYPMNIRRAFVINGIYNFSQQMLSIRNSDSFVKWKSSQNVLSINVDHAETVYA
jgi:hypothetical protein